MPQSHRGPKSWLLRELMLVLAAMPLCMLEATHTAADARHPAGSDLAARGKYVALEADCMSCHTAPGGLPYAGGYPLKSPLGTIYGPNITPDPDSGIGKWTRADFDKALRRGIDKNGDYLYPAMPYENYTKMSQPDMDALWAYMRTLRAVANRPPPNTLPFPFSVRSGIALWQAMYFKPTAFVADAAKSPTWNRGAYLVQVMGHCGQCHTPRNVAEALETQHNLGGAQIEGWYAPDISSDTGSTLGRWDTSQLAKFLKTGELPNNVKSVGPMQEAVHDSLGQMQDADLQAIAVFLKDQPPIQPVNASKAKWPADRAAAGKQVYQDQCSSCHQADGKGIPGSVPALAGDDAVTSAEPYNVIMAVLEGFKPQGTWGAMGSFADSLADEQIADVANFVRTAWSNDAVPNATPWGVETWRRTANTLTAQSHALLCPSLSADIVQPALSAGPDAIRRAAADRTKLSQIIVDYRSARPRTTSAQVVEALSTAYCRAVAADHLSQARMSAQISDFAQRVAVALNEPKPST